MEDVGNIAIPLSDKVSALLDELWREGVSCGMVFEVPIEFAQDGKGGFEKGHAVFAAWNCSPAHAMGLFTCGQDEASCDFVGPGD